MIKILFHECLNSKFNNLVSNIKEKIAIYFMAAQLKTSVHLFFFGVTNRHLSSQCSDE